MNIPAEALDKTTYNQDHHKFSPMITAIIVVFHLVALAAIFTFNWQAFWLFVAFYFITGFGITLGFHRYLTHKAFKLRQPAHFLFSLFGTLALQGGPISWVATHKLHHAQSDQPRDPHTPRQGVLWSHLLWNFYYHPELITEEHFKRFAPELYTDKTVVFLERNFFVLNVFVALAMLATGWAIGGLDLGLSFLVWGFFLRVVVVWHVTWLVNSACHIFGYQNYSVSDTSQNCWWVAMTSFGEGWHNNHHADQRAARNGHRWFEIDITYILLKSLYYMGQAYDLVPVAARLEKTAFYKFPKRYIKKALNPA